MLNSNSAWRRRCATRARLPQQHHRALPHSGGPPEPQCRHAVCEHLASSRFAQTRLTWSMTFGNGLGGWPAEALFLAGGVREWLRESMFSFSGKLTQMSAILRTCWRCSPGKPFARERHSAACIRHSDAVFILVPSLPSLAPTSPQHKPTPLPPPRDGQRACSAASPGHWVSVWPLQRRRVPRQEKDRTPPQPITMRLHVLIHQPRGENRARPLFPYPVRWQCGHLRRSGA